MKPGAQIAATPRQDHAFSASRLGQSNGNEACSRTGGDIWIGRAKPDAGARPLAAIHECLSQRFTPSVAR